MSDTHSNDTLLDMYLFDTSQNIEQMEEIILLSEKENGYSSDAINVIFRHMHTNKGSSSMMLFTNISIFCPLHRRFILFPQRATTSEY